MHILAERNRSEFLATPQLVRMDYALGANGFEPTLLVKASTLLLKYIVLGARLEFHLGRLDDRLLYAVTVYDDVLKPATLWSVVENEEEVQALKGLVAGGVCPVFLFNELALNVSYVTVRGDFSQGLQAWISGVVLGNLNYSQVAKKVDDLLERIINGVALIDEIQSVNLKTIDVWHSVSNHLISSHGADSPIDVHCPDEGGQQEQLAVWLTDNLQPRGVHRSPQIPKGNGRRELTDILINNEDGAVLIESKSISVFSREMLPDRTKLTKDVSQHIEKAIRQLRGSMRQIKAGAPVTTCSGSPIDIERIKPIHAIVLIPEFSLIDNHERYGSEFIAGFMKATGGFIHLLDIAELLRVVQAAEILSADSASVTPLMAFDYYLMERAERAIEAGTLCIQVLLRMQQSFV